MDRADLLASLTLVDYVILLPAITSDDFYNNLVNQLKPAIIATTAGDPYREYKERQAKQIGGKVVDVIKPITNKSTTKIVSILSEL
jgi:bifunctional ADP-heptose synthase (sugar kinase/adenylyltransferase)